MLDAVLGYTGSGRYVLVHEQQQVRLFDGHPMEWIPGDSIVWHAYLAHPATAPLARALHRRPVDETLCVLIDRQERLCRIALRTDAFSWVWWMRVYHHRCTPCNRQFLNTTAPQRIAVLERWLDGG